jgi:hypothetical protein
MSGPIHDQQVQHPSAWYGRDLVNDPSWLVHLTPQDLAEIAAAVRAVNAHGLTLGKSGAATFPCPNWVPSWSSGWTRFAPAAALS